MIIITIITGQKFFARENSPFLARAGFKLAAAREMSREERLLLRAYSFQTECLSLKVAGSAVHSVKQSRSPRCVEWDLTLLQAWHWHWQKRQCLSQPPSVAEGEAVSRQMQTERQGEGAVPGILQQQ